jgi:hypothetical protein
METRLQVLEGKDLEKSAGSTKGKPKIEVYEKDRKKGAGALTTPAKVSTPRNEKYFFRTVNFSSQLHFEVSLGPFQLFLLLSKC